MTSSKPYLIRAIYEWIMDNSFTPHLLVNANYPGVQVPVEYIKDGQIVLNISAGATGNLSLGDTEIEFNARFGGTPRQLSVPIAAVLYIYARENGEGIPFPPEDIPETLDESPHKSESSDADATPPTAIKPKPNHLKVIK